MIKNLLTPVRSIVLLLALAALCWPSAIHAHQSTLKTEAYEPVQQVTGHNNLRKLSKTYDQQGKGSDQKPTPKGDDARLRRLYEISILKDPHTGKIPDGIREKELAFANRILERQGRKSTRNSARIIDDWRARGPYNVGGRTCALAIDLDDENVILAGGVSGGMWRSEDGGLSWFKTTGTNEIQSVTAVVQDPRPGFRNIWYYATGERIGNSASGSGAFLKAMVSTSRLTVD